MSELDDFARDLRAKVDETIPVRHVAGRPALETARRRTRARAVRGALVASACVALVGAGLVSVPRLDLRHLNPAAADRPPVAPYEGGLLTEERYQEIAAYVVSCPLTPLDPPAAGDVLDSIVRGSREAAPMISPDEYTSPCAQAMNFKRAENALANQAKVRDVDLDAVLTEFARCLAAEDVVVTESDTLDTVTAKAKDALTAGGDEDAINTCLDGYTPRLYG
jgi:hypothetical protein